MKKDPVAIVTGGATGIGSAISRKFLENGSRVFCVYNTSEAGAKGLLSEFGKDRIFIHQADLSIENSCKEVHYVCTSMFGTPSILINNAGKQSTPALLHECSTESWVDVINTNLYSSMVLSKLVIPCMLALNWGRIINVSSIAASEGYPSCSAYAASKAAMLGLTYSLAKEYGSRGITVNAVSPSITDTEAVKSIPHDRAEHLRKLNPTGRYAKPEEIANIVFRIASDEFSYLNGANIKVSGGR